MQAFLRLYAPQTQAMAVIFRNLHCYPDKVASGNRWLKLVIAFKGYGLECVLNSGDEITDRVFFEIRWPIVHLE